MKTEKIIIWICFITISIVLLLTMIPLFMMFYTSVKPGGTLFRQIDEVLIADFDKGDTNSIGGAITSKSVEPSLMAFEFVEDTEKKGRVGKIIFNKAEGADCTWQTWVGQDVRKFSHLEFLIKGDSGGEVFSIDLVDVKGFSTGLYLDKYLRGGARPDWQKVVIPISDFDISKISPGLREKTAEYLAFNFYRPSAGTVYIDEIKVKFKRYTAINYIDVLISGPFGRYFFNSALISFIVTFGNLLFSSMVGYAFARKDFPAKRTMFLLILSSLMIPPQVLMVPIFILMKNLNWLNTYWALTVPAMVTPFNIFLMRQYISKLPLALEDAARIDGANDFQIFFKIILPLAKPALAVVGINTFMGSWNTFLYPFILTNTTQMRTLPVGLALYKSLQGADWVHLMAGSAITAIPVIVVFLSFQRYIIAGLTAGASKG